jgi:hypothetical protein
MKKHINEIKRMQQLAAIKEASYSNLGDWENIYKEYQNSPSNRNAEYGSALDFLYFLKEKGYNVTKNNLSENIDQNKLVDYYDFLLKLGGEDLAGEYGDMLNTANQFNSFEEFVNDDINTLAQEDRRQANKIKQWVSNNL